MKSKIQKKEINSTILIDQNFISAEVFLDQKARREHLAIQAKLEHRDNQVNELKMEIIMTNWIGHPGGQGPPGPQGAPGKFNYFDFSQFSKL